jgi:hypothetical protein
MRYTAVAAGDSVIVVDERTGSVQTFERMKQPPYNFAYVATDSRIRQRERAEAAAGGKPAKPADDDN